MPNAPINRKRLPTHLGTSFVIYRLVIGLALAFVHILGIALTGTSVNPAGSLAPALLVGGTALSQVWVFLIVPLAGSVLAVGVYQWLNISRKGSRV